MPKNKQQKKKERERRVAQKKHAAALKRAQEQPETKPPATFPQTNVFTGTTSVPKTSAPATQGKRPFTHRRTGG